MSSRDEALEILKKQMQAQKQRLDPKLLQIAGRAAALKQEGKAQKNMVPYDREAAAKAVQLFLKNHDDRADFEQRLLAMLRKGEH
ncbi:MAG: hypothetical protein IT560_15345 [Alphaproteobacteria bacterium]|jgi:hypothetical protein|nr:hypothetical protein [Alphaproteobacteria bacterium]